jgi:hypothetical protein
MVITESIYQLLESFSDYWNDELMEALIQMYDQLTTHSKANTALMSGKMRIRKDFPCMVPVLMFSFSLIKQTIV